MFSYLTYGCSSVKGVFRSVTDSGRSGEHVLGEVISFIAVAMISGLLASRVPVAETRDILYPDEYNFSGVGLLLNGVNVCLDLSSGDPVCCDGYAREDEFSLHCLLFANQTKPLYISLGHQQCFPNERPFPHYCEECVGDVNHDSGVCLCAPGYIASDDNPGYCIPCPPGTGGLHCG
eukprot:scpid100605/ scgid26950/ 